MYKADSSVSDKCCKYCGELLYNDPHQNYLEALVEARIYCDDEEYEDFMDFPGERVMEDNACGKCCFNNWFPSHKLP